jgi:hypothetical protein
MYDDEEDSEGTEAREAVDEGFSLPGRGGDVEEGMLPSAPALGDSCSDSCANAERKLESWAPMYLSIESSRVEM